MDDQDFPSGPWTGFFNYGRGTGRHHMDLALTFSRGRIAGSGGDGIGAFGIAGGYDAGNRECYWTKTYVGAHSVFYRGFHEAKGIWGTWEIDTDCSGGFHIWPLGSGDGAAAAAAAGNEEIAEAVGERELVAGPCLPGREGPTLSP